MAEIQWDFASILVLSPLGLDYGLIIWALLSTQTQVSTTRQAITSTFEYLRKSANLFLYFIMFLMFYIAPSLNSHYMTAINACQ